jgi:enamine deaminase RidA (YjgF/YER057c/UK114 family)
MPDDITRLRVGEKLSRIVAYRDLVFLCGQVANDYQADISEQTRQTLARIDDHLAEAGTDKTRLLSATVYVKTPENIPAMNAIWNDWLNDCQPPARTCVVATLANPDILVEITVTAATKEGTA